VGASISLPTHANFTVMKLAETLALRNEQAKIRLHKALPRRC
jgi:hypothetical protein